MAYVRPSFLHYRTAQVASWVVSKCLFKRKFLRNEIKGKKGPFVVIANHQTMLDFVNLIGATAEPMSFVISNSFYNALPLKKFMNKMGVIPKQQFQTTVKDMKRIKGVIDSGHPLVIYPAGLMCEDGLSTPIPGATYKFLKWLDADVYVARATGSYFVMPKWTGSIRPGRTYMDIYKLFDKQELAAMDVEQIRKKTDDALLFDAYREQEQAKVAYKGNKNVQGLENVLYMCPHCKAEFSVTAKSDATLCCTQRGYEQTSDIYGFLHNEKQFGPELRYVSDWSKLVFEQLQDKIRQGEDTVLSAQTAVYMIDSQKDKFTQAGRGTVTLSEEGFVLDGVLHGEQVSLQIPIAGIPTLPFSPGKHFEIQGGKTIYRCVLDDGKLVMKFINMIKIFYRLSDTKVKVAR